MNTHNTLSQMVSALKPGLLTQTKPQFLRDVLTMKHERGDGDVDGFRSICREFGSGLNATIEGAVWAMNQWIKAADAGKQPWVSSVTQDRRRAFVADCETVLAGTFGVEFKAEAA